MHRPFAARRFRGGAVDRKVALGGLAVAAIVLLIPVAIAHAPLPEVDVRDPVAARELVALMQAGERGGWIASYDFTRTLADGRVLREREREGRSAALDVVIDGSSMTLDQRDASYDCEDLGIRSGCKKTTVGATLPASEVLRVAVSVGAYNVVRRPDTTIAGLRARCFRVLATGHGGLPDLGVETDQCLSAGGISLRSVVVRAPGIVDERVATSVQFRVTSHGVNALAESFARIPPTTDR